MKIWKTQLPLLLQIFLDILAFFYQDHPGLCLIWLLAYNPVNFIKKIYIYWWTYLTQCYLKKLSPYVNIYLYILMIYIYIWIMKQNKVLTFIYSISEFSGAKLYIFFRGLKYCFQLVKISTSQSFILSVFQIHHLLHKWRYFLYS